MKGDTTDDTVVDGHLGLYLCLQLNTLLTAFILLRPESLSWKKRSDIMGSSAWRFR